MTSGRGVVGSDEGRWAVLTSRRLVGRGAELAVVLGRLERAADGEPAVVVVAGDAGVGKTRLVREVAVRADADGWTVLSGGCVEMSQGAAVLAPVAEVLRQLARDRGDGRVVELLAGPARWLAPLVPELGIDGDGLAGASVVQVLVSFHRLLRDLADEQPVLLVLEDLHWADATTRDLLGHLASRLHDERLVVVATVRTDDLDRRHPLRRVLAEVTRRPEVDRLDLGPLEGDALMEHLTELAGEDHGLDLGAIVARSQGNPFFAEELLAARDGGGLPPSLEDVLSLRLERLPADTQHLLGQAAVLGATVDPVLLERVTELEGSAMAAALRAALDDGVLQLADDGFVFRHALLREVALDRLLPHDRVAAHAAAAAALESDPDLAVVGRAGVHGQTAHHWWEARDLPRCLAASVAAAVEVERLSGSGAALGHAQRAIELWDRVDDPEKLTGTTHLMLLLTAARAAMDADHPSARELGFAAIRAADEAGDATIRTEVTARLTQYLAQHGQESDAYELNAAERARHGEVRTPASSLALTARAYAVTTDAGTGDWDLDAVLADLDEALAIARECGDRFAEFRALVEVVHLQALYLPDRFDEPLSRLHELAEGADERHWVHFLAAFHAQLCGHFDTMGRELARWSAFAATAGPFTSATAWHAWWSLSVQLDTFSGRLDAALDRIDEVDIRDFEGVHFTVGWMVCLSGEALRWAGHSTRALERADFAAMATAVASRSWRIHTAAEVAASRAAAGAPPREVVASVQGVYQGSGVVNWHWEVPKAVAAVTAAADDLPIDDDLLAEVDSWIERFERWVGWLRADAPVRPWATACLQRAQAERAFLAGAPDPKLWNPVVADFDDRGAVPYAAIARLRRAAARAVVDGGTSPECEADLLAAWQTFSDLGLPALQADAVAIAQRLRVRLHGLTDDNGDAVLPALTEREREVLALVAQGWTNKRVGEHLFISPKTVSVHLSNAMRKLDVDSRTKAVLLAQRAGLTPDT